MAKPCDLLREARERAARSQDEIAAELGVTQPCISKWEAGDSIPKPGETRQIAAAYSVNHKTLLRSVLAALEARAREAKAS